MLPNRTGSVRSRGFEPVRIHQWPPPGTPLWRNTTTQVSFTAYDEWNNTHQCVWHVHLPPLVEIGSRRVALGIGTYNESLLFEGDVGGVVHLMKAQLERPFVAVGSASPGERLPGSSPTQRLPLRSPGERLRRRGSPGERFRRSRSPGERLLSRQRDKLWRAGSGVGLIMRDRNHKQAGHPLTMQENDVTGAVRVPKVEVQFSSLNTSDVSVDLQVTQNGQTNLLSIIAYGQRTSSAWFGFD
jgi:hypothetical protein